MRRIFVLALVLLAVPLTGCFGDDGGDGSDDSSDVEQASINEEDLNLPDDAEVKELEDGYRFVWDSVDVPFEQDIELPEGATMVNASADLATDGGAWVNLTDATTELSRCAPDRSAGFEDVVDGTVHCAGLTAMDDLPAEWTLSVEANVSTTATVHFDMLSRPLDGIVGNLSLDQLSKPVEDVVSAQEVTVTAEDGVGLHAEVVRPDVDAPVPVILVSHLAGEAQAAAGDASQQVPGLGDVFEPEAFAEEMAMRGYAVVTSAVRGTGQSGGCLDVHGTLEQQDQAALLSWIQDQDWAADKIGTYGIGYAGSTAIEAAIEAPGQVSAVVSFGAVTDVYRDWHFGGVPNGEGQLDPVTGQAMGALGYAGVEDPTTRLLASGEGGCSGDALTGAADPRAVYDTFYEARNLTSQASNIQAPTLHAQGLFDQVAKPSMAENLVSNLPQQSLSLVGAWEAGLPTRADTRVLVTAWFDQHLKGQDLGFETAINATASVTTPNNLARDLPAWPPSTPSPTTLYPAFDAGALQQSPAEGSATFTLDPLGASAEANQQDGETIVRLEQDLQEPVYLSGRPDVQLAASLTGLGNAYVSAELYEVASDGEKELVSFGMANLAHHTGHGSFVPVEPGQLVQMVLPMQPTERLIEQDSTLVLEIRSATLDDWSLVAGGLPGQLTLEGGAEGMLMTLPTAAPGSLASAPTSVVPAPAVPVPG